MSTTVQLVRVSGWAGTCVCHVLKIKNLYSLLANADSMLKSGCHTGIIKTNFC